MTSSDSIKSGTGGDSSERRRERRLGFTRRCLMAVQSPVWAMTPRSLSGLSENITLNGIKITGLKTDPGQAESWVKAIHRDEFISVEILLPELEGFPRLSGQMAWVDTGGSSSPGVLSDSLNVSVGIVFSILKEKEVRALRALVAKLSEIEGEE